MMVEAGRGSGWFGWWLVGGWVVVGCVDRRCAVVSKTEEWW
jgi:hypothetical protein